MPPRCLASDCTAKLVLYQVISVNYASHTSALVFVRAKCPFELLQLLYLNYESGSKPVYMYINTPGTSTPDGRAIGFETEAFAISDCMNYIKPPVYTIGVGQVKA